MATVEQELINRDSVQNDVRIRRLSSVSLKRVIEPDVEVAGEVGPGQILPDAMLSVAGLNLDLDSDTKALLSRQELASITNVGLRFEAVLMAGMGLWIAGSEDLVDPRISYMLHEMGEETRHSRLFVRLQEQLVPNYSSPWSNRFVHALENVVIGRIIRRPALLCVLILGGEEIPDLFQKLASEHPDTDPFVKAVSRYHRQEEARHLAFGRMLLGESFKRASRRERAAVRHFSPIVIDQMFSNLVDPGVYRAAGLPMWKTWKAVQATPQRIALRHAATRPILAALMDAGVFKPGRISAGWRKLCGVDRAGQPLASAPDLDVLVNWA